jgi:hypothetical protein
MLIDNFTILENNTIPLLTNIAKAAIRELTSQDNARVGF